MHSKKFLLAFVVIAFSGIGATISTASMSDSLYESAEQAYESGDTAGALSLARQALELEEKHWEALLLAGNICVDRGELDEARSYFLKARESDEDRVRARSFIGTGRIEFTSSHRLQQAVEQFRLATKVDNTFKEAWYMLGKAGISYSQTVGHRVAAEALAKLISMDPAYRDGYRLWRDSIMDIEPEERETVAASLERYLAVHPDSLDWRLDLCWDYHYLERPDEALGRLDKLERDAPGFITPEIPLLRARCLIDLGDSTGFQAAYEKALTTAAATGDFSRLFREAETIFSPSDYEEWKRCDNNISRLMFFRGFWTRLSPDKLADVNPRLVEHYRRLRHAEKEYRIVMPHSPFQTRKNTNNLLAFNTTFYEYDPEIFFRRSASLALDARGLMHIRYGPPDLLRYGLSDNYTIHVKQSERFIAVPSNRFEAWYYGKAVYVFEKTPLAGAYTYRPLDRDPVKQVGDMMHAMEHQGFFPENIHEAENYSIAQFRWKDTPRIELVVFQQESPGEEHLTERTHEAAIAVYDTTWHELRRSRSEIFRSRGQEEILAVHSIEAPPGPGCYAIRLALDDQRWTSRGGVDLQRFKTSFMDMSTLVLGARPAHEDTPGYSRGGVRFDPRPGRVFRRGEAVTVYFELYNLRPLRGSSSFREWIDVYQTDSGGNVLAKVSGKILSIFGGSESPKNIGLRYSFSREFPGRKSTHPEYFELSTDELNPGTYRMVVEVRDNNEQTWGTGATEFEIVD